MLAFEEATNDILSRQGEIDGALETLLKCDYSGEQLQDELKKIQKVVDDFGFNDYSNLHM